MRTEGGEAGRREGRSAGSVSGTVVEAVKILQCTESHSCSVQPCPPLSRPATAMTFSSLRLTFSSPCTPPPLPHPVQQPMSGQIAAAVAERTRPQSVSRPLSNAAAQDVLVV